MLLRRTLILHSQYSPFYMCANRPRYKIILPWILNSLILFNANKLFVHLDRSLFYNQSVFLFQSTFLLAGTFAVSLHPSYVHDVSKKTYDALRTTPRYSWCIRVYRFSNDVLNETVTLSGLKLFYLTRHKILTADPNSYCCRNANWNNCIWF